MARIKIVGYMDIEDELADKDHSTGLTQTGFEMVQRMFPSLDDVDTTLVGWAETAPEHVRLPKKKPKPV